MRLCKNGWLQTYIDFTKYQQSPEVFHTWSGISAIAGALNRKCYVDRGYFKTYPNQYIVLVATSALCGKSTAAEIALKLYNEAIEDRPAVDRKPNMQKLILNLEGLHKSLGYSFCYLYNSELSTLFGRGIGNVDLMDFLTAMYTCPDKWLYETIGRGENWVRDCYINFLSCTTPSDLSDMPAALIGGGLAGRIMFIHSEDRRPPQSDPKKAYKRVAHLREPLIHDLKEMSMLKGEYKLTPTASEVYKELYDKNYYKNNFDFRLHPYQGRKGEHIIKVATVISASRGDDLTIDAHDINAANFFLEEMESTMLGAFEGLGHSADTKHVDRILKHLRNNGGSLDHITLLKRMYRYVNAEGMEKLVNTLLEANMIKLSANEKGKMYTIIEEKGEI